MKTWLAGYGAALLVVGVLDALWLGFIARDFYKREIGDLMTDSVRLLPAAVFYLGYPAGLVALALNPLPATMGDAAFKSALLGLVVYGVYDMTNMATLRHWSLKLALADMAWGTVVAAAAGAVAWSVMRWMAAR
jgi:uncharacterized membrane protein